MSEPIVGKGIDRVDGRLKVTGKATYAAEVAVANVAHGVIVGSAISRGRISTVDIKAAQQAPGVLAVLTHDNAPKLPGAHKKAVGQERILQFLQDDVILYSDQPIALVIADTIENAQYAAGLVAPTYDANDKPVADLDAASATAYTPKSLGPRGEVNSTRGNFDKGFAAATFKIDATYTTPVENHHPMELHSTTAVWQGEDVVTLYDATQGIFSVRTRIAELFDIPPVKVRVISHYVGGGFGSKGTPWSHIALAAMGAKVLGRAVNVTVTRPQMFSLVGHRPKTVQTIQLGADRQGKLTAIKHAVISETSRFDEFVEPAASQTRMLYSCPNVITSHALVRIDIPTPTFQRAPGESTGTYALESAMDELAYATAIDPLELRIRNHATQDEQERKPFSSKSLLECYRRGAAAFGWAKRNPKPRSTRDGKALIGLGMATATYPARQLPSSAVARMTPDGMLLVMAGTQDIGTGTYTIMTQIAADALAMPIDRVRFELGDTEFPETPTSGGSTTASSTGSAVKVTCLALRKNLVDLAIGDTASPLHGIPATSITFDQGALVSGGKRDNYGDIVKRSGAPEIGAEIKTQPTEDHKKYSMHSFGATFAEVRVDEDLGQIRVARLVAAYGAGKILNAKTGRSQFLGGIVWAIGMTLQEHTVRDPRTARVITRGLDDYHVPVNADVPDITVIAVDEVDPYVNELGAKGIGEIGITGMNAAIANAVFHATGKRIRDLPITLDKLTSEERA
ncbi:MAG: yagR [Myxococcales bacterium]|nr:yagR [Myxococcales bacterium]